MLKDISRTNALRKQVMSATVVEGKDTLQKSAKSALCVNQAGILPRTALTALQRGVSNVQ